MKKLNNSGNTILAIVLGMLVILLAGALVLLTLGPVYGRSEGGGGAENSTRETAQDLAEQEAKGVLSLGAQNIVVGGAAGAAPESTAAESSAAETAASQAPVPGLQETSAAQTPVPGSSESDASQEGEYILPECSTRYYTKAELSALDDDQLYLARNEIYARMGRKFKSDKLKQYFEAKSWYKPTYEPSAFDAKGDGIFNPYELANRNLIIEIEAERKGR